SHSPVFNLAGTARGARRFNSFPELCFGRCPLTNALQSSKLVPMKCLPCLILSAFIAAGSGVLSAQTPAAPKIDFPSPSPGATLKQRVAVTDIEINYSRPSVKGRKIFGSLVPYGQVWRTGANQATKVSFSTPVKINGTDLAA